MESKSSSIESWTLMSLIYSKLDSYDYQTALILSERLYAINNSNQHYIFLYAKCLDHIRDYNACYMLLKAVKSVPCLNLFARSCMELSKLEEGDRQFQLWQEGIDALKLALTLPELTTKTYWGDELSCMTTRKHMPNRSAICFLLGELYVKVDNIRAAAFQYWDCLKIDPYSIMAYMRLCDIAPDLINFDKASLPKDIFVDFNPLTTDLSKFPNPYLPPTPSAEESEIDFYKELTRDQIRKNSFSLPEVRDDNQNLSVEQLRALVKFSPSLLEENDPFMSNDIPRGDIENRKNAMMDDIKQDISKMKLREAYKNKHGLHKKPPVQTPQELKVELPQEEEEIDENQHKAAYESIKSNTLPRVNLRRPLDSETTYPNKKISLSSNKSHKLKNVSIGNFFLSQSAANQVYSTPESTHLILQGMNKVIRVLCILATGYLYQSFYHCEKAALELQKLDDCQYNSARVLCILGKAYYDNCDYESARTFFKQAFVIAPWFCEETPLYSTCLWYLGKEAELTLLAFKLKDNKSHQYESFIAAGNWSKYTKGSYEASQWFEKAVQLDPSRAYGHALLGYEEWEKGNNLGAKENFVRSMIANKRSYMGWYGMATAYQGMQQYAQAKTLLIEAVRLHPRHHVVLSTMAEVLYELEEYELAKQYIDKSLGIQANSSNEKLQAKINLQIDMLRAGTTDSI